MLTQNRTYHFSSADQNICANSVDPDEMAHHELSHQDLHYLPFCFDFRLRPLFVTLVLTRSKDGQVHFRNTGVKGQADWIHLQGSSF